jgi:hypothetical protein
MSTVTTQNTLMTSAPLDPQAWPYSDHPAICHEAEVAWSAN